MKKGVPRRCPDEASGGLLSFWRPFYFCARLRQRYGAVKNPGWLLMRCSMRKFLLGILLLLIFPPSLWGKAPSFSPAQTIALVFSSNIHGEVEPCG